MRVKINRFSRWLFLSLPNTRAIAGTKIYKVNKNHVVAEDYSHNGLFTQDGEMIDYEDLFIVGRLGNEFESAEVGAPQASEIESFFQLTQKFEEQKEYKKLKEKFGLSSKKLALLSPVKENFTWNFFNFLRAFSSDGKLLPSDKQIVWLEKLHENAFLAEIYDRKYIVEGDVWAPARASSFWRKAKNYEKAIQSTNPCINDKIVFPNQARAAALTSRAAVLKSMKQLTAAENCLRWAYKLDDKQKPHLANTWGGYDAL